MAAAAPIALLPWRRRGLEGGAAVVQERDRALGGEPSASVEDDEALASELRLKRGKVRWIVDEGVGHGVVEVQLLELARRLFRPAVDADAHEARDAVVVRAAPSLHLRRDRSTPASPGVVEVNHRGRPRGQGGEGNPRRRSATGTQHLDVKLGAGLAGKVHLARVGRNEIEIERARKRETRNERSSSPEEAGFELNLIRHGHGDGDGETATAKRRRRHCACGMEEKRSKILVHDAMRG